MKFRPSVPCCDGMPTAVKSVPIDRLPDDVTFSSGQALSVRSDQNIMHVVFHASCLFLTETLQTLVCGLTAKNIHYTLT